MILEEHIKNDLKKFNLPLAFGRKALNFFQKFYRVDSDSSIRYLIHAIKFCQKIYGLREDGILGNKTLSAISSSRCGCPDVQGYKVKNGKWKKERITWEVQTYLSGMSSKKQNEIFDHAFKSWSSSINLDIEKASRGEPADIIINSSRDRSLGLGTLGATLAVAEVPQGDNRRLQVWFDESETWKQLTERTRGTYLLPVGAHEFGHIIGLYHSDVPESLQNPYYNERILGPQKDDIKGAQALYGKRRKTKVPTNNPPVPRLTQKVTIEAEITKGSLKVSGFTLFEK